jgi:hypothetical protein
MLNVLIKKMSSFLCMAPAARAWIVRNLLGKDGLLSLTDAEIESICMTTDGMYTD